LIDILKTWAPSDKDLSPGGRIEAKRLHRDGYWTWMAVNVLPVG
jgi:hypothetical protein